MEFSHCRRSLLSVVLITTFAIGYLDYVTGKEIRVYPLYFMPIAYAAIHCGASPSVGVAILSTGFWVASNWLNGTHYFSVWVWIWNAFVQFAASLFLAWLVIYNQRLLRQEKLTSRTDALTGLMNVRAFWEQVPQTVGLSIRAKHQPITLAFVDLDDFKKVNDVYGHSRGDRVLRQAAEVLKRHVRIGDLIGRIGGDEFVLLLPNACVDEARGVLERIRSKLEETMRNESIQVTASIGAVVLSDDHLRPEDILHEADALMYQVKRSGKNGFIIKESEQRVRPVQKDLI